MKNWIVFIALLCVPGFMYCQNEKKENDDDIFLSSRKKEVFVDNFPVAEYDHLCEITVSYSLKSTVEAFVDLGVDSKDGIGLLCQDGKKLTFASEMSVINYFQRRGWSFCQFVDADSPAVAKALFGQAARDTKIRTFFMCKRVASKNDVLQGIELGK